jgi:hypothetical protein
MDFYWEDDFLEDKLGFETLKVGAFGPLIKLHLLVVGGADLYLVDLFHVEIG